MKTFGCVRFVYNKMLEERIRLYEDSNAKQKLPKYKPEFPFLKEVDSLSLSNAQMDLNKAYHNFFRDPSVGFPKFKSKHNARASYYESKIVLKQHRPFDGVIKSATVSMTKTSSPPSL
ncbi:Hypothetical protein Eab7_2570 [Exiguobacterium antarcticum B7]|nr:Hypothetical protein Eab7_2570 [Exiguobacterium antarcticum B7]